MLLHASPVHPRPKICLWQANRQEERRTQKLNTL